MAELFKNIYTPAFFDGFTEILQQVVVDFDSSAFINNIFDSEWDNRELKQRMRHISVVLKRQLSADFENNAKTIVRVIAQLIKGGCKEESLEYMFLPDFIEFYGLNDYQASIQAFEQITQFSSCEFAVRPFLIKYQEEMMRQMILWSEHKNPMVRRLASEGSRPRLPWAMAIPSLKQNPNPVIPILEKLKDDASESVRRSVANNLNDISKDNPDIVINLVIKWQGVTKETDWLIKHGCRTLLKQGHLQVMEIFGFGSVENISVENFKILTPKVKIGEYLEFNFKIKNDSEVGTKLRLEYGLYYQKANGSLSRKVFKISEKNQQKNSISDITRKQSFKIISTRKFHLGLHQLSIIINGVEFNKQDFELVNAPQC